MIRRCLPGATVFMRVCVSPGYRRGRASAPSRNVKTEAALRLALVGPRPTLGPHRLALGHACVDVSRKLVACSWLTWRATAASWVLMSSGAVKGLTERRAILD